MKKIRISLLGATGSIGASAVSVIEAYPRIFQAAALAAGGNYKLLFSLARRLKPSLVSVRSETERGALSALFKEAGVRRPPQIETGEGGLLLCAAFSGADVVLSAVSGAAGLRPTFAALEAGKVTALANKESLVMAGELLSPRHRELIRPVDSEHSAVFQALGGTLDASGIRRIILTASGGPFRGCGPERLRTVTPAEALAHPSWSMGPRITVDSATLLNKGFEVIEAVRLFSVPFESVKVVIHPQSIIHSLIEHPDGSLIAQMGTPDMRLAVAYALAFPERLPLLDGGLPGYRAFSFDRDLTFEEPDRGVFRCLALAEEAGRSGGTAPSVLNAAGEVAAEAFLKGRLPFTGIAEVIEDCLGGVAREPLGSLDDALLADSRARECASELVRKYG